MDVILTCMDCRLNSKFRNEKKEDTLLVRNAGGNLRGVEQTLRHLFENNNIGEFHIATHTDCGAMKYLDGVLNKNSGEESLNTALVDQFRNSGAKTLTDLEKRNEKLQKANAESLFSRNVTNITSELIDISTLAHASHQGEHVLVVTRASDESYETIAKRLGEAESDCYIIQADTIEEVIPDIAIAVKKIGIESVTLMALKKEDYRQMLTDTKRVKLTAKKLGWGELNVSFVKL